MAGCSPWSMCRSIAAGPGLCRPVAAAAGPLLLGYRCCGYEKSIWGVLLNLNNMAHAACRPQQQEFIPLKLRVLWINLVAFCWSVFLILQARAAVPKLPVLHNE